MDRGSPSPTFRVGQSSPLDTLVRRASSRRARVAKLADALTVPYTPPGHDVAAVQHDNGPHSPLLHTQFRGSVASTSPSMYDGGAYVADGHSSGQWDPPDQQQEGTRCDSLLAVFEQRCSPICRPPYQPPASRQMSMASVYSTTSVYSEIPSAALADVPTVVVSPSFEAVPSPAPTYVAGRMPIQLPPGTTSYSRPIPPPVGSEEQKRQVLMRHAQSQGGTPPMNQHSPSSSDKQRPTLPHSSSSPLHRSTSQLSVYSSYSYYAYDGQIPSPSGSAPRLAPSPTLPSPTIAIHPPSPTQEHPPSPTPAIANPQTAQEYLQLGIQHHLANRLSQSASCFEKSATLGGGCGMGMLMWGLAQRHGWGCPQSEARGFRWLRRAAEMAVVDLERTRAGMDSGAIKVRRFVRVLLRRIDHSA